MELGIHKVRSEVERVKQQLIRKWDKKGGYENFGQTEIRKLRDKVVDISDYSVEMRLKRKAIDRLDSWAMEYDGSPNQFD
jgi:hypothetical protein